MYKTLIPYFKNLIGKIFKSQMVIYYHILSPLYPQMFLSYHKIHQYPNIHTIDRFSPILFPHPYPVVDAGSVEYMYIYIIGFKEKSMEIYGNMGM